MSSATRPRTIAVVCSPPASGTRMRSRTAQGAAPDLRPADAGLRPRRRRARRPAHRRSWSSRRRPAAVREAFADEADFALQDEPRGTGDARPCRARDRCRTRATRSSCSPATCRSSIRRSWPTSSRRAGRPTPRWRWSSVERRRAGRPRARRARRATAASSGIVEERDATPEQLDSDEINAGLYAFDVAWLRARIGGVAPSAATGELYLTELVELARADDRPVACLEVDDDGVAARASTTASSWPTPRSRCASRINERHMRAGVTHRRPGHRLRSMPPCRSAEDVTIEPDVVAARRDRASGGTRSSGAAARSSTRASASAASSGPA